ncbi:MAG: undecaprenyl-diphosphate phosphatase [Crocinitomicaceae bacterium]|nr:undecaprenyl-diphosphate phosphatase [Crocinitomicaceae bacterium]MCF8433091.1 undecaprenyl-diphosphate phosphatase [Crocinitomicaceae bacterium]
MNFIDAIILAIIEGLTEFLPVSSTAHMIFMSSINGTSGDEFVKMFQVSIQFGAILSVVALYWRKFFDFKSPMFYVKLALAVVPALVLGKLFDDKIEAVLEKPIPIAIVLIIGGFVLLFIDRLFQRPKIQKEENITIQKAVVIGFWQCLAMMPGTSRSAASIIGGMQQGLTRKLAAEFSFFLAVPTMLAVTCYSIFLKDWNYKGVEQKGYEMITSSSENITLFVIGNVIAFVVAALAIKLFIGIIDKYGFKIWGIYRIIVGTALLIYFSMA